MVVVVLSYENLFLLWDTGTDELCQQVGIGELCLKIIMNFKNTPLCFLHLSLLFYAIYLGRKLKNLKLDKDVVAYSFYTLK